MNVRSTCCIQSTSQAFRLQKLFLTGSGAKDISVCATSDYGHNGTGTHVLLATLHPSTKAVRPQMNTYSDWESE